MPPLYRKTLAVLCLPLLLPVALSALAAEPAPAKAAAAATEQRAPLLDRSQEDAQALARQLPTDEQQQLQAGSDTFLALWSPANSGDPQGAVVIVPGAGETADWPQTVGPLRRKLPDVKWATLSLTLPDLDLANAPSTTPHADTAKPAAPVTANSKATPPDAGAGVEKATAPDADNGYTPPANDAAQDESSADAERIFARIDAGIAFAQQQNARSIVLIGNGTGAYWAARYLGSRQAPHVQKLVMIAAKTPGDATKSLDQYIPAVKVPTADFFYNDREQARQAAALRLQTSKRLKDSNYRQVSMNAPTDNSDDAQEPMIRRVRGWLSPVDTQ